jgi:hypothetical protein
MPLDRVSGQAFDALVGPERQTSRHQGLLGECRPNPAWSPCAAGFRWRHGPWALMRNVSITLGVVEHMRQFNKD